VMDVENEEKVNDDIADFKLEVATIKFPIPAMVLSDLTHWILQKICSSDGPWTDTYFYVLIELL
jgi:hypothetical protein